MYLLLTSEGWNDLRLRKGETPEASFRLPTTRLDVSLVTVWSILWSPPALLLESDLLSAFGVPPSTRGIVTSSK